MKKNARPIRRAGRLQRRLERPKAREPCPLCIELEHSAGRNHDSELTFAMCQRHHDELTERRRQAEISMRYEPDPAKRVALALRATSVFLEMLGEAHARWSDLLDPSDDKP
jgi:hypothetical protein